VNQIAANLTQQELNWIAAVQTYGPQHPNVKRLEGIRDETRKIYDDAVEKLQKESDKAGEFQLLKDRLAQESGLDHQLMDLIHQTEMKLSGQNLTQVDIIEPPRVDDAPSYPRKSRVRAVAMVVGALLGAGLALLRDRSDGRMRSVEEMQNIVGLPILGVVPVMSGRRTAVARAMTVHLDPRSIVAEAYRTIRTAIYFGLGGNNNGGASSTKTILVTSPEPGDGKTTSASNLAIAIAQTGRSVLLLDADFRKPSQHKNLEIKNTVGLSSVLAGTDSLEAAVQRTGVDGLDILPCGPIPANPSEILNSREFGELVDTLASRYDHILFDSPPVNAVTDARILGAVCDATILVLRADKSTRKSGEHARNALLAVGARMLGAIVNDASKRKGYDIYGGSYYGSPDIHINHSDQQNNGSSNGGNGRSHANLARADW
jgi:capsular exopolysaccharide synthesis family protein